MKNTIQITLMILFTINSYSQTIKEIDSDATKFCEYIKSTENIKNDSIRINEFYQTQFDPFLSNFEVEKVDKIARQLFYRLQRNCLDFSLLLDRLYPPKENVIRITEKPKTKLTDKEIKEFWNRKTFKYFENNGNETIVQLNINQWIDVFTDSTYSKLRYKVINNYEFELEFIESNNESRANYNVVGDKFVYGIIEKKDSYYLMSSKIDSQNHYEIFKLYFD
ncbi:MAG TPA: hypothetical protein VIN72_10105 [Lutibacter sp.]